MFKVKSLERYFSHIIWWKTQRLKGTFSTKENICKTNWETWKWDVFCIDSIEMDWYSLQRWHWIFRRILLTSSKLQQKQWPLCFAEQRSIVLRLCHHDILYLVIHLRIWHIFQHWEQTDSCILQVKLMGL